MAEKKNEMIEEIEKNDEENDLVTVKFAKPVMYDGKEYAELSFDFESLTGADGLALEAEVESLTNRAVIMPAYNSDYLVRMATRACTTPVGADIFNVMPLRAMNKIKQQARNFLLSDAE